LTPSQAVPELIVRAVAADVIVLPETSPRTVTFTPSQAHEA